MRAFDLYSHISSNFPSVILLYTFTFEPVFTFTYTLSVIANTSLYQCIVEKNQIFIDVLESYRLKVRAKNIIPKSRDLFSKGEEIYQKSVERKFRILFTHSLFLFFHFYAFDFFVLYAVSFSSFIKIMINALCEEISNAFKIDN